MSASRQMHLALVIGDTGFHQAAWRLDGSRVEQLTQIGLFKDIAQRAEQAHLDSLFMADVLGFEPKSVQSWPTNQLEPVTLLSALAVITQRIGLIGTQSSTFHEPYNIARQFLSLDHLSQGRAGWNAVTSRGGHAHYGLEHLPEHHARYTRAIEAATAVKALWESWEQDAIVLDKKNGHYAVSEKINEVNFHGQYIQVKGALPSPRSVQGRPVIVQAGSSEEGRNFAAQHADIVFTMQPSAEDAKAFYQDLKARAVQFGRSPEALKVFQGITPFAATTQQQAQQIKDRLDALTDYHMALQRFEQIFTPLKLDLTQLDQALNQAQLEVMSQAAASTTATKLYQQAQHGETLRSLLNTLVTARGHWSPVGTATQIAQQMQQRVNDFCTDGFIVLPCDLQQGLDGFLDHIVPYLKNQGAFRTAYQGQTLRAHLGLQH